jgi:hypothetical protein
MSAIGKLVGKVTGAESAVKGAERAARTQAASAQAGIDEQRHQFDVTQQNLAPFLQGGQQAMGALGGLVGLGGADAQSQAIQSLAESPQFQALLTQGEEAILQNAAATGGLRGGNTQAALAQFRPQLLAQAINDQFGRLAGVAGIGQGVGVNLGGLGQASAQNIAGLLGQQGAARAGAQIARGNLARQGISDFLEIGNALSSQFANVMGGMRGVAGGM